MYSQHHEKQSGPHAASWHCERYVETLNAISATPHGKWATQKQHTFLARVTCRRNLRDTRVMSLTMLRDSNKKSWTHYGKECDKCFKTKCTFKTARFIICGLLLYFCSIWSISGCGKPSSVARLRRSWPMYLEIFASTASVKSAADYMRQLVLVKTPIVNSTLIQPSFF